MREAFNRTIPCDKISYVGGLYCMLFIDNKNYKNVLRNTPLVCSGVPLHVFSPSFSTSLSRLVDRSRNASGLPRDFLDPLACSGLTGDCLRGNCFCFGYREPVRLFGDIGVTG